MRTTVNLYRTAAPELQTAVWKGDLQSITTALVNGADPNALAAYGDPMLVVASSRGHLAIVKALLAYGAAPNFAVQNGPALLEAVRHGHSHVAEALLEAGAAFGWRDAEQAALYNRIGLLEIFLRGVPVNQRGANGDTLLMSAAFGGHIEATQALVDAGADVNASNGNGWTALLAAASNGKSGVVGLLVRAGANPKAADKSGDTPLKMAAQEGHTEIAAILKAAGAHK
jgi:ankyrin repeat protein